MEILIMIIVFCFMIYLINRIEKSEKECNELVDDYDLLQEENIKIRKEIAKVKEENQDLVQIILKYHEN